MCPLDLEKMKNHFSDLKKEILTFSDFLNDISLVGPYRKNKSRISFLLAGVTIDFRFSVDGPQAHTSSNPALPIHTILFVKREV